MQRIKHPAVAGMFYPDAPDVLRDTVDGYVRDARVALHERPLALIAPHAGYRYSGPIAGSAYATLAPWADSFRRAVVLAPSHRVPLHGIALSAATRFQTPLGIIDVDSDAVAALACMPLAVTLDAAYAEEHALEVQLPFLQRVLGDFLLVPLIVGQTRAADVKAIIDAVHDDETLIVVSSDLSHFHSYDTCRERDRRTSESIEQLRADAIGPDDACGAFPMRGLLARARAAGWQGRTVDLRNSGDTAGDRSRVVGYGAYAFI